MGLGIVLDADQQRVPHPLCVPCLMMTLLAGPVGFLTYLGLRTAILVLRQQGVLRPGAKQLMRPKVKVVPSAKPSRPTSEGSTPS